MNVIVSLPDDLKDFVESKVADGAYESSSEVVRDALRLMEQLETQSGDRLTAMKAAWEDGLASGEHGEIDFVELAREARLQRSKG